MIPPTAQRQMAERAGSKVVEVMGSHPVDVAQPEAIASAIQHADESI